MKLRDVLEMPGDTMISVKFARELFEGVAQGTDDGPAMLSVKETARRLGMSDTYIYDNADELGCIRLGRSIRFPADTLEAYFEELRRG